MLQTLQVIFSLLFCCLKPWTKLCKQKNGQDSYFLKKSIARNFWGSPLVCEVFLSPNRALTVCLLCRSGRAGGLRVSRDWLCPRRLSRAAAPPRSFLLFNFFSGICMPFLQRKRGCLGAFAFGEKTFVGLNVSRYIFQPSKPFQGCSSVAWWRSPSLLGLV